MAAVVSPWAPTQDEVRRIVAELRPLIDECVSRSRQFLATAGRDTAPADRPR
jgi:hypothetical protein